MKVTALNKAFGNIDIYLLDAIMKGHFENAEHILDAGCGEGRNLPFFLSNDYSVVGIDKDPDSIRLCKMMARSYQADESKYAFFVEDIRSMSFPPATFDMIICSAVLHFAKDKQDFLLMFEKLTSALKENGIIFIRMASELAPIPENSENNFTFLLSKFMLDDLLARYTFEKVEPVKSVLVEDKRVMTTLLLKKKL